MTKLKLSLGLTEMYFKIPFSVSSVMHLKNQLIQYLFSIYPTHFLKFLNV